MHDLESLYGHLLASILRPALARDAALGARVAAWPVPPGGELRFVAGELQFTLPALFDFAWHDHARHAAAPGATRAIAAPSRADYLAFRRLLYQRPTNAALGAHGGAVVIAHADPDHDRSVYRLTTLAR